MFKSSPVRIVLVAAVVAMGAVAVSAGSAQAGRSTGAPEAVASPYTRTDPTGDCVSGAGSGGARCDLVKLKVVNRAASVKLTATYAGTPFFPPLAPSTGGYLIWNLEGATDRTVRITNHDGTLDAEVLEEPYLSGAAVCWSGFGDLGAPVIDGLRVIVDVPRACLGSLTDVRVFAHTEKMKAPSAAVSIDRAPNTGYTPRITMAP